MVSKNIRLFYLSCKYFYVIKYDSYEWDRRTVACQPKDKEILIFKNMIMFLFFFFKLNNFKVMPDFFLLDYTNSIWFDVFSSEFLGFFLSCYNNAYFPKQSWHYFCFNWRWFAKQSGGLRSWNTVSRKFYDRWFWTSLWKGSVKLLQVVLVFYLRLTFLP